MASASVQAAKLSKTSSSEKESVELVECDLEKEDTIENALGNAGVVVCSIGASEKEVSDVTGPYRIDYKATENLIKAGNLETLGTIWLSLLSIEGTPQYYCMFY